MLHFRERLAMRGELDADNPRVGPFHFLEEGTFPKVGEGGGFEGSGLGSEITYLHQEE